MTKTLNLFADIPENLPEELFETLLLAKGLRIERIVSHGQASPADFWYDQSENEWVLLLQGAAKLRIEDRKAPLELVPGDHVLIAAHTRHRVDWTDPNQPTIWLAIHYSSALDG
ncbi:MAG: cupin protein [Planctomycetaceae bacterium]|nr:cupin protein [Planctomycetaceae bacterium]